MREKREKKTIDQQEENAHTAARHKRSSITKGKISKRGKGPRERKKGLLEKARGGRRNGLSFETQKRGRTAAVYPKTKQSSAHCQKKRKKGSKRKERGTPRANRASG